ncbi:hypothetical protein AAFF_G00108680 [Aldrovandia affinis]|uniref:Uncharacterized protein n=1 Tax=Aldrovandia affinis TaxID=143900 RepID=A0AAD7WBY0_9TELE|nr:hypothetical protein AAFF_G00108680 [Aldrovandia affinis]
MKQYAQPPALSGKQARDKDPLPEERGTCPQRHTSQRAMEKCDTHVHLGRRFPGDARMTDEVFRTLSRGGSQQGLAPAR